MLTVVGLVALVASALAGALIWLLVTEPAAVATTVNGQDLAPLAGLIFDALRDALVALIRYL